MVLLAELTKSESEIKMENLYSIQDLDLTFQNNGCFENTNILQSNIESYANTKSSIEFVELTKLADKQKWMKRFLKEYSGCKNKEGEFYDSRSQYIIAKENDTELGYIRITSTLGEFKKYSPIDFKKISDAYVKPCYRNRMVLRALIKYVVDNHNTKILRIEPKRFLSNKNYYNSLGFNNYYYVGDRSLIRAFQDDIWPIIVKLNKDLGFDVE